MRINLVTPFAEKEAVKALVSGLEEVRIFSMSERTFIV